MVLITEVRAAHRLIRPFLGVGVLGGFTTFSTYAVEARDLLDGSGPGLGLIYLAGTVVAALVAVEAGIVSTRWLTRSVRHELGVVPRVEAADGLEPAEEVAR